MKNKKGFTLIELLAAIVILSIILAIATFSVIKNFNDSKEKVKYIAARDITTMAGTYMETETEGVFIEMDISSKKHKCVEVQQLINKTYLESDATNPLTGKNGDFKVGDKVCSSTETPQEGFRVKDNRYTFDGYSYIMSNELKGDVNQN
ncbi:MAG: prepilin-type N-terminal cleavage/methylation domain-containing protein, partial [Bacilli bacterium]